MKVLISAYSCAPGEGSEPEAGLNAVLVAAQQHDVWVLFRADQDSRLRPFLADRGLAHRVHLEPLDIGQSSHAFSWSKFLTWSHYLRWQRKARRRAQELDAIHDFDLVHHATYATYYTGAAVAYVRKPFVWGPVGGGTRLATGLWSAVGWRGNVRERLRWIVRSLLLSLLRPPHRLRSDIEILAQNSDTARAIGITGARIVPNGASVQIPAMSVSGHEERTKDVLVVGRLYPNKGGVLAVRTAKYMKTRGARIAFIGDGSEQPRLERLVRRLGVTDRVQFRGVAPRHAVMDEVRIAGAFFHPAVRDESPLAVAEAMTLGTPVICVHGTGADELASLWPTPHVSIAARSPKKFAQEAARALDLIMSEPPPIADKPIKPEMNFADEILSAYERAIKRSVNFIYQKKLP